MVPFFCTTRSFGPLRRLPSNLSASTTRLPWVPLRRPGQPLGEPETALHRLQLGVGGDESVKCGIEFEHGRFRGLRSRQDETHGQDTDDSSKRAVFLHENLSSWPSLSGNNP